MRHVLGMALVISAVAGHAAAQSGDASATADQLFDEARELARANRWPEACARFEASLRADPALGSRLNLATCYEHIGELARAWSLYRESADLADKAGDARRRDYAQAHAAALEPRLARRAEAPPSLPPTEPVAAPSIRTYVALGLGATGLATAGVGLLFGAKARSNAHDAKELCGTSLACAPAHYSTGKQLIHDARSDATRSTALVAGGGAALAAGAVVFLTRPDAREPRAAQVVPVAHEHGAGIAITGRF